MLKYGTVKFLLVFILVLVSFACTIPENRAEGVSIQETTVAGTVDARLTEVLFNTLVAQLTQAPEGTLTPLPTIEPSLTSLPSATLIPPTSTPPPPTLTPTATFTPIPPSPTPIPCNRALFVADVTIPDNSVFNANTSITKVWRLSNNGSCTWTTDYQLIFISGSQMGGVSPVYINTTVPPNQTVDVAINLITPGTSGSYAGFWMLRSPSWIIFGIGLNADIAFWVKTIVSQPTATLDPNIRMDFSQYYCYAKWVNSSGVSLACPSSGYDFNNASVTISSAPMIETAYQDDEMTIITIPNNGTNGVISGRYPPIKVLTGDRFQALLGCLASSPRCSVTFHLKYSADSGPIQELGSWVETFDGNRTQVDVDLSPLNGKSVEFILEVQNNGDSSDDRAFWMVPHIKR
jgi:hypothetical protein